MKHMSMIGGWKRRECGCVKRVIEVAGRLAAAVRVLAQELSKQD